MGRYTPGARAWIVVVTLAAALVTAFNLGSLAVTPAEWIGLAVLTVCAAFAHIFPIKSVLDGASLRLTNVFVVAGAAILPGSLLTLLPALAITPDTLMRRKSPGAWIRWTFNVSQTAIATQAAGIWVRWANGRSAGSLQDLGVLFVAAVIFTVVQEVLVGFILSFNNRVPIHRAGIFTAPSMQGNALVGVLGVLVGALWLTNPVLLVLVLPLLVLAHRLTLRAHLAELAQVDAKTGLHNYRHFEQVFDDEMARSLRVGRPLAILFADIDLLRHVNNSHGHLAGDRVLLDVSNLMRDALRKGDLVARFGGEEFIVLLPGTDAEQATFLAERMRQAVAGHVFMLNDGTKLHCTISVGVAVSPDDAMDLAGLIKQADIAMYRAKETRNSVARVRQLPPVPRLPEQDQPSAQSKPAPQPTRAQQQWGRFTLWATVAGGLFSVGWALLGVGRANDWLALTPFLLLAVAAEFITVRVYEESRQEISLSFTIAVTMAAVTLMPPAAPLVSLTAAVVHLLFKRQTRIDKILFNLTNPALAAGAASWAFLLVSPSLAMVNSLDLLAAGVAVLVFDTVNYGIISLMISLHAGRKLSQVIRESGWYSPAKLFLGMTGAFMGGAHANWGWIGDLMFAVPLLILRYTLGLYTRRSQQSISVLQKAKEEVEQAHREKEETLRNLIETISSIIDARDNATFGHSRQVARYAVTLGRELSLPAVELAMLHTAALLHDLGKVGIPEAILHKPGRLTAEEYAIVKEHASLGEQILQEVPQLGRVARMVGEHHERYDGGGYPAGKAAEEISIGGRILAVADALDSILTDRPYSKGRPLDWALAELDRCTWSQFDPEVMAALHRIVEREGADYFPNAATLGQAKLVRTFVAS